MIPGLSLRRSRVPGPGGIPASTDRQVQRSPVAHLVVRRLAFKLLTVDRVRFMAGGRNGKNRGRQRRAPQEQLEAIREYRLAVGTFQQSAFWNLRTRIANVAIVIGFLAAFAVAIGEAGGARLVPTLTCAVGGVCGAAVYFTREYPAATKRLLIAAVALTVLGVLGLVVVTQVLDR